MNKFVFLTDAHCGTDRIYKRGKYVEQPSHNQKAIEACMDFIKDYDPDVVICGGDMGNFSSISHHTKHKRLLREGMRLKDELDLVNDLIVSAVENRVRTGTKKVWIQGNHEKWVDDHIQEYPELEGMFGVSDYLKLEDRGWEFYDYGEVYTLGKLNFMHGENTHGFYHAANAIKQYHCNIRYGHHHTYQVFVENNPINVKDFHTAISVPCLADRNPSYGQNRPNRWINGFLKGWVARDGSFNDEVIVMANNSFSVDGRWYGR